MKKFSSFLSLLFVLLPCTCVSAQNIGADLARIVRHTESAREVGTATKNPSLDTIVLTLAYYGGMPDMDKVNALLSGSELLVHYAGNPAIRGYLLDEELDVLLEAYTPPAGLSIPASMAAEGRAKFLEKLSGAELFSRDGAIDLRKIHDTYAAPAPSDISLKAAAAAAAQSSPGGISTANLVGNALAGLSDWISRRAQEELTYTFLTNLRDDLQRNNLNYLFPKTSEFLPTLDLLSYKSILPSIRKAFLEDLNALAFNLGNYLDNRKTETFRDPTIYNVFLIYRILDLQMRDVSLAEILSYTYGELERTRIDTRRLIDLRMAGVDTSSASYKSIVDAFNGLMLATDELNANFEKAQDNLSTQQFDPLLTKMQEATLSEKQMNSLLGQIREVYSPINDAILPLKNNYRENGTSPPPSGIVKSWLNGQEAYKYYEAYPSLTRYDELFGEAKTVLSPAELRAAGLTAVREVLANRNKLDGYNSLMQKMFDAREELIQLDLAVTKNKNLVAREKLTQEKRLQQLKQDLEEELNFRPAPALRMLRSLAEEIVSLDTPAAKEQIKSVEIRLREFVVNEENSNSPLWQKMQASPKQAAYFPPLQQRLDNVQLAYDDLHAAMTDYTANTADSLVRSYYNLSTFETVFGIAQQVFFLLSTGEDRQPFVSNRQLADFQTNATARKLFAGLGRERLARVPDLANATSQRDASGRVLKAGAFSSTGITDFLLDFGLYLADFQYATFSPDLEKLDGRARQRVAAVDFITKTLSTLLEAPILNSSAGEAMSLAQKYPTFANVPAVNRELNKLFRQSRTGEYRYAMENLLELIKLFNIVPTARGREKKLIARRDKLRKLIYENVVENESNMSNIGLALPKGDRLPLVGNNDRDKLLLARYETERNTPGISTYARTDADNSIRDLKIRRIQEELSRVQTKIKKLNPERTDQFRAKLFRYGTFMADVAKANTSNEFETAINSIALPVGSSQIKRNRASSLELGAYFGAALSRERLVLPPGISAPELEEDAFGAALFVPVGFSYSRNIGGSKSITLFGSLLDLGALTAFRLESRNNDVDGATVERLPQFRPANVIAPGLHLMYNFPKSPFTLGFGVQDGPSVRKFTLAGQNQVRDARSTRAMLTLSVDVPIFRFFNK